MKTDDLNDILSRLAKNSTRENVLDLSFALLQWMGIEPNAANKPQLLAPQTQKLKDFLVPAPQTVQPQLYRLSADPQNIRVRFAVLKKMKKDYITQLTDNDPGFSSYQASIKGILNLPEKPSYIPSQPYFIHFVTTPEYDKLVLIFNQGEQKRIVSLRDRLTNTQYHKIISSWENIGTKSKPEIADLLWKSLDVKEVNQEFYKQIKERFDALSGIIKSAETEFIRVRGSFDSNAAKQFAVRLIGRYIFCWFLKEKRIIPTSLMGKEAIEKTENYYQTALLPLFFETLNAKVQDRNPFALNPLFKKIPYLNGGLFDESEEDKLFANLKLDAWLLPFAEILESYDFTVDESSSQYQQAAVDPEMLGRIFENLLASQNEETEKLANQRKAFGAFYTPREIVDYMVNESIRAFLKTQLSEPGACFKDEQEAEKKIAPLFAAQADADHLKKEEKNYILQKLEQIKILDPACGSGAFPMGILHKLTQLHEALGTVKSSYELKKDILSRNIYGADIMPMAIEIARLRAWLSLVLEEDYKPNDPVHNFGVKPLPNLDFKFVCANSLIDLGLDAFIQDSKGTLHEELTQILVTQLKALEDLRKQFFTPALASVEKEKLKTEYLQKRDEAIAAIETDSDAVLKNIALKIKHWNPFDDSKASPFFSPAWMLGVDNGFDVVIGNPPYVQLQKNDGSLSKQYEKAGYQTFERTGDIYSLFYERAWQILKLKGTLCFITSNKWMRAGYGESTRKFFAEKTNPILLLDFAGQKIFDAATVDTNILMFTKDKNQQRTKACLVKENPLNDLSAFVKQFAVNCNFSTGESWVMLSPIEQSIKTKIEAVGMPLCKWDIDIYRGITTGYNEAFIIDGEKRKELIEQDPKSSDIIRPVLRGRDIKRYKYEFADKWLLFIPWHFPLHNDSSITGASEKAEGAFNAQYPAVYNHLMQYKTELSNRNKAETGIRYEWYALQRWGANYWEDFSKQKITYIEIMTDNPDDGYDFPCFSFDTENCVVLNTAYIMTGNVDELKYILGVLNSKLGRLLVKNYVVQLQQRQFRMLNQYVVNFPIPKLNLTEIKELSSLVDRILKCKRQAIDIQQLRQEIDSRVYKFYNFDEKEIEFIESL